MDYKDFLSSKSQAGADSGFKPVFMPDFLFDFQKSLTEWAVKKGRAAIFADCGLGKTPMELVWAENVVRKTNRPVLILTPLAVSHQIVAEGEKFGIEAKRHAPGPQKRIIVTNYERLHHLDPNDYAGVALDESSILKSFDGSIRQAVTEFMRKIPYRLLATATAAPNDYIELGTSSEALGVMERKHMLAQYFTHDGGETSTWRLKGHARTNLFWRFVCSWARAIRRPSDLGFEDAGFVLPQLKVNDHIVKASIPRAGYLFDIPANGLSEQREDLKRTLRERCEMVASLVNSHKKPAIAWCHLNAESDLLAELIDGAVNVQGSDSDDAKEDAFKAFVKGEIRVIVSKPTIAGFGLNWQHCNHMTIFPSHSYEQYYQCVRRCWRFGQKKPVTVDVITTDGQSDVLSNLLRKDEQAGMMFENLVSLMGKELAQEKREAFTDKEVVPSWL